MKLYLPITVDLYNIYPLSIMNVQQYNIGRGALVTLTAAGQVVVPNKESLYVYAKKKDGTIAYATCTLSGNQIKIDYDEQMTAIVGTMTVELQMVDENGNSITTPIFQVNIQPSNIDYKKVTSSDEFLALVDALNNVNSFQNQINELNEKLVNNLGKVPELAIDFDDAPLLNILTANNQSINKPPRLSSNAFLVLQLLPHNKNYSAQVVFGFGNREIAMRTRASGSSTTWSDWDYFVPKSYIDNKSKLKVYDGDGCAVKIFGETAIVIINAGKFPIIKGGNNNENVIATLPSNIRIPGSFILWQQVTLVSENWTPINDIASIVDIKNSNGIVMRCSFDHSNVEHIYGSIIIPSELVTITS